MQIEFNPSKTYTNTITESVGATTSTTTRALVDTNTSHYIYLDATNGNDGNGGTSPGDAKATFEAAFTAISAARRVIHILDSSTYTVPDGRVYEFNNDSTYTHCGIQAALGETPVISGKYHIIFTNVVGMGLLSGLVLDQSPPASSAHIGLIEINTNLSGSIKFFDNTMIHTQDNLDVDGYMRSIMLLSGPNGTIEIIGNAIVNNTGIYVMQLHRNFIGNGTGHLYIDRNVFYQAGRTQEDLLKVSPAFRNAELIDLGGILLTDFEASTLIATISATSPVTSFPIVQLIGLLVYIPNSVAGSGGYFRVVNNTSNQLFLENVYNYVVQDATGMTTQIYGTNSESTIWLDNSYVSANKDILIRRNIFVGKNHRNFLYQRANQYTNQVTTQITGNVIINYQHGIVMADTEVAGGTTAATINSEENLFYVASQTRFENDRGNEMTPNSTMTIDNDALDGSIIPLYFNQDNAQTPVLKAPFTDPTLGYYRPAYDFRLREMGKKYYDTDDQIQLITSYLVDRYTAQGGTLDLCPWVETLTEGTISYDDILSIDYDADKIKIVFSPKNPVELYDLHGNPNIDWDSWRKQFTFTFDSYMSNESIWKFRQILQSKLPKKLYPLGDGTSILTNATTGTLSNISNLTAQFAPIALSVAMIPHHWRGFWITLIGSGLEKDYYIQDNDESTLYLVDKLEHGYPVADDYMFSVEYILVQNRASELSFGQDNFTGFLDGGQWQEKNVQLAHEYTHVTITFIEHENPLG